jgi:hypothetical protein
MKEEKRRGRATVPRIANNSVKLELDLWYPGDMADKLALKRSTGITFAEASLHCGTGLQTAFKGHGSDQFRIKVASTELAEFWHQESIHSMIPPPAAFPHDSDSASDFTVTGNYSNIVT